MHSSKESWLISVDPPVWQAPGSNWGCGIFGMNIKLKRYKKEFQHSYTFGVFPTLELLTNRPDLTLGVVFHPKGVENSGIHKIRELCQNKGIPYEVQEKAFSRTGARDNDYAIGVFQKEESGLDSTANHVILVNPSGTGNLGSIMRTMVGFDFQDLAIILPAVDIFHPEVLRASMGAIFQIHLERIQNFEMYRTAYPRHTYALVTNGAISLREADFSSPLGLVFGNEGAGLPDEILSRSTGVKIPQNDKIDSLNLAVAVGVTLYQVGAHQEMR
jgi:TrmH family RNA methyltransferase